MNNDHRIRHIDAWRFIAVSMVICSHIVASFNISFQNPIIPIGWRINALGHFGVLIFFFISGFVICRGLMEEEYISSKINFKAFYVRRTLRIIPPLYIYLMVVSVFSYLQLTDIGWRQIAKSALFLCNITPGGGGCGWNAGHTWSLGFEEQFYLIFPIMFSVFGLRIRPVLLVVTLLLVSLIYVGLRLVGIEWFASYISYMIFLLTGCAAALFWNSLKPICIKINFLIFFLILFFLISCIIFLPEQFEIYVQTIVYPPLVALLVLGTPVKINSVRHFFHNSSVTYLGKISYSIYLWQQLATSPYPAISPWWTLMFVLCALLLAYFSYQYFERPLMGVAHRWSDAIKHHAVKNLTKQ